MTLRSFVRIMSAKSLILPSVRPLAFAFFALASFAASAFDTPYLTFRSASSFSLRVSSPKWDGKIEYSTDTVNWTEWNGASVSAALSDGQYRLYFRGENNKNLNGGSYSGWSLTGSNIYCDGDIEALRGYSGNPPAMAANCCKYMFSGQSALVSAPSLSATTLADSCYYCMFQNCTGLKTLPSLPATYVPNYGYYNMFAGCTGIEIYDSAPDATWSSVAWSLPANVTGGSIWYYDMFKDTGGSFTGNPTADTTYYVASALPPGQMYQAVNSGTLTPVFTGSAANWDLSATIKNGVGNLTFTYANGTLPPGVAPSGSSLVGTPTATGTYNFTLSVTDADNNVFNSATYSVVIMAPMANVSTPYIDASGAPQTHDCLELNANVATWDQGWYVVSGNLNFGTGGITVDGNVNLVLADGASMSVVGGPGKAGVNVPYGSSLTIYGQSGGTGTLTASGNSGDGYSAGGAGIGGNNVDDYNGYQNCGTIVINGGTIVASGGNYVGAGIGGGNYGYGGTITINGGTVTATGGSWYGAGIGGGNNGNGGTITINGGVVNATGGNSGAGIGGGSSSNGGTIRINGGNVTATAGDEYEGTDNAATGIGNGSWGYGTTDFSVADNVTVKAGAAANPSTVLEHGTGGAITIGTQRYFVIETEGSLPLAQKSGTTTYTAYTDEVFNLSLASTISGGTQPYAFAHASGTLPAGLQFANGYTTITGTPTTSDIEEQTITMTVTDDADGNITATYTIKATTRIKTITYMDGETVLNYSPTNYTPGSSLNIYLPSSPTVSKEGYTFVGWYRNPEFTGGSLAWFSSSAETTNLTFYAKFSKNAPVSYSLYYYDYEEATGQTQLYLQPSSYTVEDLPLDLPAPAKDGYTFVGWGESYASEVTITTLPAGTTGYKALYAKWTENTPEPPEPEPGEGEIEVSFVDANGDPMQQLCTVVTADTATLTNGGWYVVNADVERSGAIVVEGSASLVLVNNKSLTVQGESFYPGIAVTEGNTLAIYGQEGNSGTLTATGGDNGAGIGGGASSAMSVDHSAGTIIINGGTVVANGGTYSAGIGGGNAGNGGVVTVNGGSVTAKSTWLNTPGIGGGYVYSGTDDGTLTVAGKMAVLAGETSSGASERNLGTSTRTIEIDKSWGYFFIEERTTPVGTFWSIQYRDTNSSIINGLSPSQYKEGEGVSLAAAVPTKTGYTFDYWYEYGSENVPVTEIPANATGDKVFYAKWTATEFTIEYYLKGELVELSPSNYTVAAVTRLPEEVNGYYVKWHDNPELQGNWIFTIGAGSGYARNIKLYADADPIPYTITFYDSETGDQFVKPYLYMVGYNADYEAFDLPRTAHKDWRRFVDWYDNIDCTGDPVRTIPTRSFGNKKFYAKWEATTDPVLTVDADGNLVAASLNGNTEIEIPSTVRRIDTFVFYDFTTLEAVTIPSTVTNIDEFAFCNCTSLKQLELPESLRVIGWCAFDTCSSLESVYIPKGVTVGDSAFFLCESLKSVNIGGTVVQSQGKRSTLKRGLLAASPLLGAEPEDPEAIQVGKMAFSCCGNLESARVGAKVADIGGGAFSGCAKLDEIIVEEGNENFESRGGMLLTKGGAMLISGTGAGAVVGVPSGVTSIADGAFAGSDTLQRVTLPDSVTSVGEAAFSNCTALAVATIPSSVTSIGAGSFCNTALATVYVTAGSVDATRTRIYGTGYDTLGVRFIEMATPGAGVPSVKDDSAATVIGNASNGYTVLPSAMEGAVEVTIPDGLAADKVTVEVPATASVKPNGANVKVVNGANDITAFLDLPAAVEGVIDLNNATVKPAIVKEALDPTEDGVVINLTPSSPVITTAPTRAGLTYTFSEGTTLTGMTQKATKTGDGTSWTPTITVKGGTSGFYSIGVTK